MFFFHIYSCVKFNRGESNRIEKNNYWIVFQVKKIFHPESFSNDLYKKWHCMDTGHCWVFKITYVFNPTYSNLIILRKNSSLMVFYMMKVFHVKNRFLIVFYVMKVFHVKSFSNFTRRLPALYYYLSHKKSVSMFLHQRFLLKVA